MCKIDIYYLSMRIFSKLKLPGHGRGPGGKRIGRGAFPFVVVASTTFVVVASVVVVVVVVVVDLGFRQDILLHCFLDASSLSGDRGSRLIASSMIVTARLLSLIGMITIFPFLQTFGDFNIKVAFFFGCFLLGIFCNKIFLFFLTRKRFGNLTDSNETASGSSVKPFRMINVMDSSLSGDSSSFRISTLSFWMLDFPMNFLFGS